MALNLNAIKALFGKLAPHAGNVAKGVVNYGDDAARLVANYGDDAARAVANYGDDALAVADKVDDFLPDRTFEFTNPFGQTVSADYNKPGVWNIDGKTFHDLSEGDLYTSQSSLKKELLNKRTNRGHPHDFIESRQPLSAYFIPPEYDVVPDYDEGGGIADYDLVEIPGTARPHKNTALGRWYDDKARDWESLVASAPDVDYGALRDQWYADSAEFDRALDLENIDNMLLNDVPFQEGDYARIQDYLSNLRNPTGWWRSSTPLKPNDSRLENLYGRLNKQLSANRTFEDLVKQPVSKPRPKPEILKDLGTVDELRQLLSPVEQLKFDF